MAMAPTSPTVSQVKIMCGRPLHSTGMEMGWVDFDCVNKILLGKMNVGRMRGQSKTSMTLDPDPRVIA